MTQTQSQHDPIARLALFGLMALVCVAFVAPGVQASAPAPIVATPAPIIVYRVATPTAGLPDPPAAPVVLIQPTEAPPPTLAPVEQAPVVVEAPPPVPVEQAPVVVEPPAPPEPPATAVPEPSQQLASGVVVVQTKQQFIDSFAAPPADAKCAFVGCLP